MHLLLEYKTLMLPCRAGIVPLDNTSDIVGPIARSVADVALMLEVCWLIPFLCCSIQLGAGVACSAMQMYSHGPQQYQYTRKEGASVLVADAGSLQVLAGPDPNDSLTQLSKFLTFPINYTRYLDVNGLKVGPSSFFFALGLGSKPMLDCFCLPAHVGSYTALLLYQR